MGLRTKQCFSACISAFGAAIIILMAWIAPFASNTHAALVHTPGSIAAVVVPILIVFAVVWVFWWLLLFLSRNHNVANITVWTFLCTVLIWEAAEDWHRLKPTDKLWQDAIPVSRATHLSCLVVSVLLIVAVVFLYRKHPVMLMRLRRLAGIVLVFIAISGSLSMAKVIFYTWQARDADLPEPLHRAASTTPISREHPRVIWIILDELSYRQVYEHRYADLQLPAFDQLAKVSTLFTDVRPEGRLTGYVVPSLLSGIPGTDVKNNARGTTYWLLNGETKQWQVFDPHKTVFQDAVNAGYQPAVAGWTIPYCRILPYVLDRCYWTSSPEGIANLDSTKSIGWNLKKLTYRIIRQRAELFHLVPKGGVPQSTGNQDVIYKTLVSVSDGYLEDPSLDFIYLHMNIPHPGGFYQRHTGKFSRNNATYLDNLALADVFLGHLRSKLEADGTWDDTTLVVMGDHSWRTNFIWAKAAGWSPEEQVASDGDKFDDRPGYIVHLAGQSTPARIEKPFEAIRSRALFDALFRGEIRTPEQLATWADR
jgi:hypothetical protein